MFNAQGTQHVNYRGEDGHIHELWLGSSGGQHNDLTNAARGAPQAVGNPKGYMFDAQGTQHVNYRSGDGHIHELWWANGWRHGDLTNAAGNAPLAGSDPKGYMFDAQGTQHVIYMSPAGVNEGGSVHELWWDNKGWHHSYLTNAIPVVTDAWERGTPYGYMFNARGTQHVIYTSRNGFIHELWWDSDGWHHSGLTNQIGAFPVETAGYVFEAQDTQHVNYRTNDGHIQELWWGADGDVHHSDLTNDAGGAPLAANDPKGYMFDGQGTQHVIYVSSSGNVMELYWVP